MPSFNPIFASSVIYGAKGDTGPAGADGADGADGATGATGPSSVAWVWEIDNPAIGEHPGFRVFDSLTVRRIDAYVIGATNAEFNIEERSDPTSAGVDVMGSEFIATTTPASVDSDLSNADIAAGNWVYLDISAISGTPTKLVVSINLSIATNLT